MAEAKDFHGGLSFGTFFVLVGELVILTFKVLRRLSSRSLQFAEIVNQIRLLGVRSLSIANLTAVFAGMVLALQFGNAMVRFGAREYVGQVVSISILRELGPVLTALMVGGRIGAGMTAELGSMKVTEQIDAIRVLGADPIARLIVPRVIAATIVMPLLTALSDFIGIVGGLIVSILEFGITPTYYYQSIVEIATINDFASGVAKSVVFGYFIALIACAQGFSTAGGTEGVGQATTRTVVIASVNTLIADLILTKLFLTF
ncbi:MAG: ABC transporter permease [Myxococcales bacterium]|nr:MAG: ABC transporter permease [Myxococcales bacterium]